jgi:diguanylate cyclase (GGDEF)-like protein
MALFEVDSLRKNEDGLQACLEIGKSLTSTLDIQKILELIMSKVSLLIPANNWSLLLLDEKTGDLRFEIAVGLEKEQVHNIRIKPGEGIAGSVFQTGIPIFIHDAQNDIRFSRKVDEETGFVTQSIICVPVQIRGRILGVIEIINVRDMSDFESRYLPILNILADYVAIAIENSNLFAKIERLTITDEYTDQYNARYLHQNIGRWLEESKASGKKLTAVFSDIDHFKTIVDTYGHFAAGQVLKEIAQTIALCLSAKDVLIKYGGDEYVIILREKGRDEAAAQIERITRAIEESCYLASMVPNLKISSSFGMAVFPDDASNEKDLLILADNAMFESKRKRKACRQR